MRKGIVETTGLLLAGWLLQVTLVTPAAAQVPNELPAVQAIAAEGAFAKCEAGNPRACSLFARYVAWRLNPTADPARWGWLQKNPGETGYDGYAEDAIVFSSDPSNLHNVIDLVGGAGAPGARVQWGGPHPRRPSNPWVAPRALTAEELAYLGIGGTPRPPTPGPTAPAPPTLDTAAVLGALDRITAQLEAANLRLQAITEQQAHAGERLVAIEANTGATAAVAQNLIADGSWLQIMIDNLVALREAAQRRRIW